MAKTVIGIDIGLHSLKAVCVSGSQLVRAAMIPQTAVTQSLQQATEKAVSGQFKELMSRLKAGRAECHFAINSPAGVLRYVETPYFPQQDLRASLKLNHSSYLRQSYDQFTFDGACLFQDLDAARKGKAAPKSETDKAFKKGKTAIGGLPSSEVLMCYLAAKRAGLAPQTLNLAALALINGFECAYPQVFREQAALLLDIGHASSNLTIINRSDIFLTRVVNLGGKHVIEHLVQSQGSPQAAEQAEAAGGDELAQALQVSLAALMREVHSSVNFFERNAETDLNKIYLSGRLARAPIAASVVQKEVGFTCESWDPAQGLKNALPAGQKELYAENQSAFAVAIGTARSALN